MGLNFLHELEDKEKLRLNIYYNMLFLELIHQLIIVYTICWEFVTVISTYVKFSEG